MDPVRVDDHAGRGAVTPTHERPQFVRPVVESIVGAVVRCLSTPGVQFLGMQTSRNSRVFHWFVPKVRGIC